MQELISKDKDGNLTVNSLVISQLFGRPHKNVLQSLDNISNKINGLDFKPGHYVDKNKEEKRMLILSERQALIAMPFIGGKKSIEGQVKLVDAFIEMREILNNSNRHIDAIRSLLLLDSPSTWERLYDDSFFIAIMNLHGHNFHGNRSTPSYCSNIIRRWIYDIVLPEQLQSEIDTKRGEERKHQWFTKDNGRQALLAQIGRVEMLARTSESRADFEANCARAFLGSPLQLNIKMDVAKLERLAA